MPCPAATWSSAPATPPGTPSPCSTRRGVPMEAKPFAVGVRIEHRQADCRRRPVPAATPGIPGCRRRPTSSPATCPAAARPSPSASAPAGRWWPPPPRPERVVTNGMSEFARDRENINGGLLVNVTPEDFGGATIPWRASPSSGSLEAAAFALGGGDYRAPAQRVGDFLAGRPSAGPGRVHPSYRPGVTWTDLRRCLPRLRGRYHCRGALPLLGQKLRGYDDPGRRPHRRWRAAPPPRCASPGTRPASPPSGACTPAARAPATPAASSPPPRMACAVPSNSVNPFKRRSDYS